MIHDSVEQARHQPFQAGNSAVTTSRQKPPHCMKPKRLTSYFWRKQARFTRDRQWRFMERVAACRVLWFCVWNKNDCEEGPDEWRDGLITGLEIQSWMERHRDWFRMGQWSDAREARPIQLKRAGCEALKNRKKYDMEPVYGGLMEPGFVVTPARAKGGL